jgi:hypothetical protein
MASIFSGKAGRNAALWTEKQANWQRGENQGFIEQGFGNAKDALTQGYDASLKPLEDYYKEGQGFLQTGMTDANAAIMTGLNQGRNDVTTNYGAALDATNKYYGQSADTLQQSAAGWQPLIDKAMTGYDMYSNSMGLNGAAGRDAALNAFQAGPGYQWQVDQATDQAARAANKLGMTYSGNTIDAQTRLANNLANQEWGNWQKNLQGFQGAAERAVTGQTGVMADLANTYEGQAKDLSTINMNQGNKLADLSANAYGQVGENTLNSNAAMAQAALTQGTNLANLNTGFGQSIANLELGNAQNMLGNNNQYWGTVIPAGQAGMMAGQQAAGNKMGAILGGAQMGMQLLGGAAGGGFNLGSFFGGK